MSKAAAESQGCSVEFKYMARLVSRPVINDDNLSLFAQKSLEDILPANSVVDTEKWYVSESFSYYSDKYPSILAFLGIKNEDLGSRADHHNAKFDIDDDALEIGVTSTVKIVVDFLNKKE